jgi:hypothetical protein
MNALPRLCKIGALVTLLAVLAACVAAGYDGAVGVGYVGDYYEPGGYGYGGWGPGYRVGPPGRRGDGHPAPGGGRSAPSIPHGGGGHGGGGHGGGGHGGGGHGGR